MDDCGRVEPPMIADEMSTLLGFLDVQRETVVCKLRGLSDAQVRQTHPPSSLSLLGIVKHLTDVERGWFREHFNGEELSDDEIPGADPDRFFRIDPADSTRAIIDGYRAEYQRSNALVRAHSLDDLARPRDPKPRPRTLRWIMFHMLEETARHAGHADLIRESIDGSTGE